MPTKYFVIFLGCIVFMLFIMISIFTNRIGNVYIIQKSINRSYQNGRQTNKKGLSSEFETDKHQIDRLQNSSGLNRDEHSKYARSKASTFMAEDKEKLNFGKFSVDTRTTDALSLDKLPFLSNYKNPCWMENVHLFPSSHLRHKFVMNNPNVITPQTLLTDNQHHQYRLKCLPYVYVIGPQKSGTTDLFDKLVLHPKIDPGLVKEPHWWSRSRIYPEYRTTLAEYSDLYNIASEEIFKKVANENAEYHNHITVDATPELIWDNWLWREQKENFNMTEPKYITPHYIRSVVPQARIIAMLRNPTDRLYSDYKYFRHNDDIYEFHSLVMDGIKWLNNCFASPDKTRKQCIYDPIGYHLPFGRFWNPVVRIRMGLYSEFLVDWFEVFSKEQLKIFKMEDYSANQVHVLNDVFQFLGLENMPENMELKLSRNEVSNKGKIKGSGMLQKTENALNNFYRPFNQKLTQLLGDKENWWDDE